MTPELIALEYAHLEQDKKLREGGKEYTDESYDEWDEDSEGEDTQTSFEFDSTIASEEPKPAAATSYEEWEDVEDDED